MFLIQAQAGRSMPQLFAEMGGGNVGYWCPDCRTCWLGRQSDTVTLPLVLSLTHGRVRRTGIEHEPDEPKIDVLWTLRCLAIKPDDE